MLTRINRIHFFSLPLLRHYTTTMPSRVGLIKLPDIKDFHRHLKDENTIIFAKNNLFYAELQKKALFMIYVDAIHPKDYMQLKNQCGDTWRTATPNEMKLIQRVLEANDQYRSNQRASRQQNSYTSTPNEQKSRNTAEAHDSAARLQDEKRDKAFWQTMYFAEVLDGGFHPRPNEHPTSKPPTKEPQTEKRDRFFGPHSESTPSCSIEKHDSLPSQQHTEDSSVIGDIAGAVGSVVGDVVDAVSDIFSGPD